MLPLAGGGGGGGRVTSPLPSLMVSSIERADGPLLVLSLFFVPLSVFSRMRVASKENPTVSSSSSYFRPQTTKYGAD